jgi:predicted ATP-dependent serine protease
MNVSIASKLETKMSVSKNFTHIPYEEKIKRAFFELHATDPKKIMKRWRPVRDNILWWIYGWQVVLLGWNTGTGKSTRINQVCRNVASQWIRVVKYSLEDRMEEAGKQEIYYEVNRQRKRDGKSCYQWVKFVNNEYNDKEFWDYVARACEELMLVNIIELDKNKQVSIDELVVLMEEEAEKWTKFFAIDHLHYFHMDHAERQDIQIENIMHAINEIARKHDVCILLAAHYVKNTAKEIQPTPDLFRWGGAIKQVANVIIQIDRQIDSNFSEFYVTKLRWPIKPPIINAEFDL